MSSPYRPSAATGLPGAASGFVQLSETEYANLLLLIARLPVIDDMDSQIPAKIYEPVMASGELVTTSSGDCLVNWGGLYAS